MSSPLGGKGKPKVKLNKWWIAGGGIAAVAVFYEYRKRASSTPATAATTTTGIDPNTGQPYANEAIDPTTGVPYVDESGSSYLPVSGSPYAALSPTSSSSGGGSTASSIPSTNQSWFQQAVNYLVSEGYSQNAVNNALSNYLQSSTGNLSQNDLGIVQTALSAFGTPPTSPPTPVLATNTGQSSPAVSGWLTPPTGTQYTRNSTTGEIDQVQPDGTVVHLTPQQWAILAPGQVVHGFTGSSTVTPYAPGQLGAPPVPSAIPPTKVSVPQ